MFCEDMYRNTSLCISCMSQQRLAGHYNCIVCCDNHMSGRASGLFLAIKNKIEHGRSWESWHMECWGIFGDLVLEFELDT